MITRYEDLSINQYEAISQLCKDESLTTHELNLGILSVLTGIDEDTLLDKPITEFNELMKSAGFITQPMPNIHNKRVANAYHLGEFVLRPMLDVTKWTASQYIDFQEFSKREDVVGMLTCILVPKQRIYGKDYEITQVKEVIGEELSIIDAQVVNAFFLRKCRGLIKGILTYSGWMTWRIKDKTQRKVMRSQIKEAKRMMASLIDGAGYTTSTKWQR